MTKVEHTCPNCNKVFLVYVGYLNKANNIGAPRYCTKACSALARKINRSDEEKKRIKSEYDKKRRTELGEAYLAKKREQWKARYDPVQAAEYRKKRMHIHVEYCRQPEYRQYKKQYDEQYHAKKKFGEFAESALLLTKIYSLIDNREVKADNNLITKSQKRKRQWLRTTKQNLKTLMR